MPAPPVPAVAHPLPVRRDSKMPAGFRRPSHALAWASLASLTLAAGCTDRATTLVGPSDAPSRATIGGDVTTSSTTSAAALRHVGSGLCATVPNAATTDGTVITLAACAGQPQQSWSVGAVGVAGPVSIYSATKCLSLQYGMTRSDDRLVIRGCVANAGTQTWTVTADGTLRNPFGRCMTVIGSASAGAALTAVTCVAGDPAQRFTVATATAPAPTPPPAPPPPSTTDTRVAAIFGLMGAAPTVASTEARGGTWARYESDFRTFADRHWAASGADWSLGNFYDRAMMYYVWWARSGNQTYLDRANQMAVNYRRNYLEANAYGSSPHWLQIDGVALHYLVTGDAASLTAVGRTADGFAGDPWIASLGGTNFADNRIQARTITALLDAWKLRAPSTRGYDWAAKLRQALPVILATQSADGAYRERNAQCGYNKPFMVGMLNDALIRYYETFERDPRILPAVRRAVDYMWARNWLSGAQSFQYLEGYCTSPYGDGDPSAAPDLNLMIVSGYGWVGRMTGDGSYYTKGDAVFAGGVTRAWIDGQKQFNQQYTSSYRYLTYRF